MVSDREAPGSHWLGLARNDLEFAYLKMRVHMMNSIVVLSPFWVKNDLRGGSVLVFLIPPDPPRTIPRRMPEYLRLVYSFSVTLFFFSGLRMRNPPGKWERSRPQVT